ncbi:MAG: AmmeMemoRadiSam system protein B [Planctomycetota bacterium]|nr:MAG: AmmeMemoRadiSam system protein B [Planctomycetota bacterium]
MRVRRPAVAGSFYPASERELSAMLERLCARAAPPEKAVGAIAPHAGYVFSGGLAGAVWSRVVVPRTVLLLGPNHTGMGAPFAVWDRGAWLTPLGAVEVDAALAEEILDTVPLLERDYRAHTAEHSIEVHLPFLQHFNPDVKIVPVCISHAGKDELIGMGEELGSLLAGRTGEVLVGASTDMTHFRPAETAARLDAPALEAVAALDAEGLYDYVVGNRVSMCGVMPVTVLLAAAVRMGAERAENVGYTHSGMVTGDHSDVVAYAGFVIRGGE